MKIKRRSILTGVERELDIPAVTEERMKEWRPGEGQVGKPVQEVFPELTADQREFLLSGVTREEWDEHFKDK